MSHNATRIRRDAKAVIERLRAAGHDPHEVEVLQSLWVSAETSARNNAEFFRENQRLRDQLAERSR